MYTIRRVIVDNSTWCRCDNLDISEFFVSGLCFPANASLPQGWMLGHTLLHPALAHVHHQVRMSGQCNRISSHFTQYRYTNSTPSSDQSPVWRRGWVEECSMWLDEYCLVFDRQVRIYLMKQGPDHCILSSCTSWRSGNINKQIENQSWIQSRNHIGIKWTKPDDIDFEIFELNFIIDINLSCVHTKNTNLHAIHRIECVSGGPDTFPWVK